MSIEEKHRLVASVSRGDVAAADAAEAAEVSLRTMRRWVAAYRLSGKGALRHGLCGRPSNNAARADKEAVMALALGKYARFNLSHMAELLGEREGIAISRETLRVWLARPRRHRRPKHRRRRQPCPNFGDMLQIDGSFHQWFGGRRTCLINIVDDATKVCMLRFEEQETIEAACRCAWGWFLDHGVPKAFYADGRNMYHWLKDSKPNLFTAMCRRLAIRVIVARSPQAKGRVERANGVHQDRLVPLLDLDGVTDIGKANNYCAQYIRSHNSRFRAEYPGSDSHRPLPAWAKSIDDLCFIETPRTIANDWTFRYGGKTYQIPRQSSYPPAKSKINLKINISGRIIAQYRGVTLTLL